jgi:prepilin-type N-terminal cleavage/methylation domain-containing protein
MDDTTHERRTSPERRSLDRGFTLVEVLIVIVILDVLATVTVLAVRGVTNRGQGASCQTDRSTIAKAAEYYLAENNVDEIPASGVGVDRYERT